MQLRKIGAHVSAAGGVEKALERAQEIGANCVQIFSGSPRVWLRPDLQKFDSTKIAQKQQETSVDPIFTHALYLVNLASENPELLRKSQKAILFDLTFDARIGGAGVVVHLGSHKGMGWEAVREQVATQIQEILKHAPADCHFLMENAAGQNGKIGGDLAELRWLLDQVQDSRLGWCFDTCHGFAAGYHLERAAAEIERLQLAETLRCVHVNDSRDPFDSGRDRHANLGDGEIASDELRRFLHEEVIREKPLILEVPGIEKEGPDAENIQRLRKLVGENAS